MPENAKPACQTPNNDPPNIPIAFAQMVRQGSITIMAMSFGATRKSTGLMAMVSSASISSVTLIVANFRGERRT